MKALERVGWIIECATPHSDHYWRAWIIDARHYIRGYACGHSQADAIRNALIALCYANHGMDDVAEMLEREYFGLTGQEATAVCANSGQ